MKTLYLECNMGAAGDMLNAALLGVCPTPEQYFETMNHLGIEGLHISAKNAALRGCRWRWKSTERKKSRTMSRSAAPQSTATRRNISRHTRIRTATTITTMIMITATRRMPTITAIRNTRRMRIPMRILP